MLHEVEVDEEVHKLITFGCVLTGWTPSEVIKRLAQIRVQEALNAAFDLGKLAEGAPKDIGSIEASVAIKAQMDHPKAKSKAKKQAPVRPSAAAPRAPMPSRRDLAAMIKAGQLKVGDSFKATYNGSSWRFKLLEDGGLAHKGKEYSSPGTALKAAYGKQIVDAWGVITDSNGTTLRNLVRGWWADDEKAKEEDAAMKESASE